MQTKMQMFSMLKKVCQLIFKNDHNNTSHQPILFFKTGTVYYYSHHSKGLFIPSESERESKKDQRDQRKKNSNIKENFRFRFRLRWV